MHRCDDSNRGSGDVSRILGAALLLGLVCTVGLRAEVITIPVGEQAPEKRNLPRPTRGMSTDAVLERFGLPESRSATVGDPPISMWRYADYTVYFETETVIHSVLTHTPKVDITPEQ